MKRTQREDSVDPSCNIREVDAVMKLKRRVLQVLVVYRSEDLKLEWIKLLAAHAAIGREIRLKIAVPVLSSVPIVGLKETQHSSMGPSTGTWSAVSC